MAIIEKERERERARLTNIGPPPNTHKSRRYEITQRKIERPIRRRTKRDSLSTDAKRIQLWRIDP